MFDNWRINTFQNEMEKTALASTVTDRQSDELFDTIYMGIQIFLPVKFATSLLTSLVGGGGYINS